MTAHLPADRLVPDAVADLDDAARAHLAACPRCRVEAKLLARAWTADATVEPGFALASTSMDDVRSAWRDGAGAGVTLVPDEALTRRDPTAGLPTADDDRFEPVGLIGEGGMGQVHRVRDAVLHRTVAMKVAAARLAGSVRARDRFVGEARIAAQLQHPGIVPVHDLGLLPDGRPFFTMKEVDGTTLTAVVRALHAASSPAAWGTTADGWTLRRVVEALHRVAETVAYSHARGVCHRDLKPDNVMLGAFGEVLVLDWGLAKVVGTGDEDADLPHVGRDDALATRHGAVAGTPAFMPPEQARGEVDRIGPAADVYALGALLYAVLTGRPPYRGLADDVLAQVRAGPPPPPSAVTTGPPIPDDLDALCVACLRAEPSARPAAAADVATALRAFLDGAHRRELALAALARAEAELPAADAARAEAARLRRDADALLATTRSYDPEAAKQPGWRLLDAARAREAEASVHTSRFLQGVQGALTHDPDLAQAHARLADHYRHAHAAAEALGDTGHAAALEVLLRAHDTGAHTRYLDGLGTLTLHTDVPARVVVRRVVVRDRRRVVEPAPEATWTTPVRAATLPCGSYRLEVAADGRAPVVLPVAIGRDTDHVDRRPGDAGPHVHRLPAQVPRNACFVAAGWFASGGDPRCATSLPGRRVWVDAFVIDRDPVTVRDYLAFLDDLAASGRVDAALAHAPRERPSRPGVPGDLLVDHVPGQGFRLRPDAEGDTWDPEWPVWMVSWHDARAYAAWRAARDGLPWRLPWELEWEKAARGVDGRAWPWGDFADPSWAAVEGSRPGRPMPARVDAFPVDTSPYGVRGLAGNLCDWTLDAARPEGPTVDDDGCFVPGPVVRDDDPPQRIVRGGLWSRPIALGRTAERSGWDATDRRWAIGFRLAASVDG